ncbi:MAG: hypothetical protein OSB45_12610 [Pseudomonadales bacterium]|jgi:hypothetical protein|nr:hypothetical protein [Pseudomonadales bacterium]
MNALAQTAPAFVAMAHSIVWCNVATGHFANRPRSLAFHPFWEFDGDHLIGWVATAATPIKKAHLAHSSYCSVNYWTTCHDTCVAECAASWCEDSQTKQWVWNRYLELPEPVGSYLAGKDRIPRDSQCFVSHPGDCGYFPGRY